MPFRLQVITLALLGVVSASAPAIAVGLPFHITAMAGLTISKLRGVSDPFEVLESLKGFGAGVGFAWPLAGSLEIQPEALYVQKGISFGESVSTDESGNPTGKVENLHVVDALEVPLLLRWEVPTGARVHPVLEAGPFVSFEIAERHSEILKDTDYGGVLGAGLELNAGPGRWVLEGRYEPGLADLGSFYGADHVHSGAWVLLTGFRY